MKEKAEAIYYRNMARVIDNQIDIFGANSNLLCLKSYSLYKLAQIEEDRTMFKEAHSYILMSLRTDVLNTDAWTIVSDMFAYIGRYRKANKCMACCKAIKHGETNTKTFKEIMNGNDSILKWAFKELPALPPYIPSREDDVNVKMT